LLDKRQTDIDKEAEIIKERAVEIRQSRSGPTSSKKNRKKALEKAANLSVEEARAEIMKAVEKTPRLTYSYAYKNLKFR